MESGVLGSGREAEQAEKQRRKYLGSRALAPEERKKGDSPKINFSHLHILVMTYTRKEESNVSYTQIPGWPDAVGQFS
jgi:hypothetical protein